MMIEKEMKVLMKEDGITERYQSFFEMANLTKDDTGLPYIIWISPRSGKEGHWARIKVAYNGEMIPVSISDDPEIKVNGKTIPKFNLIKNFIIMNKDVLLDYWNSKGEMSLKVVFNRLKKLD